MASSKQRFNARCAELCIEVDHQVSRRGIHHLMVYAPAGKIFEGYGIDCICLWEGERGNPPDWKYCLTDMENMLPLVGADPEE